MRQTRDFKDALTMLENLRKNNITVRPSNWFRGTNGNHYVGDVLGDIFTKMSSAYILNHLDEVEEQVREGLQECINELTASYEAKIQEYTAVIENMDGATVEEEGK